MRVEQHYIADDGTDFKNQKDCIVYEDYLEKTNRIMSKLRERKDSSQIAVKQDIAVVKEAMKLFFDEVAKPLLNWDMATQWIDETVSGVRHPSHVARIFCDNSEYPILWKTYFRFQCINMKSGVEYAQPYYVDHENEFTGVIE